MIRLPLPLLLALLSAIPPLAIDMYLPAMGLMATDLNSDIHHVELTVSTFLVGYALGQLFGGPLSDRLGRKPVILVGISLFALSSLLIIAVESLDQLLALRVLQALGGGLATVNSAAIVRDRFHGNDVAKTLSMVAMIMMLAPLLAPLLGSLVIHLAGWREIFTLLSLYSLAVVIILLWQLEESHPKHKRTYSSPWRNYGRVLRHKPAMIYVLALAFGFTTMFEFITASPYLYLKHFQQSPAMFPWLFGANIIVMMLMNRANMLLLNRYRPDQLLLGGLGLQLLATLLLAALFATSTPTLIVSVILIALSVGSIGLVAANAMSLVLHHFKDISGSATALIGVTEFCIGALFGYLWSLLHDGTPLPMMLMMCVAASMAIVFALQGQRLNNTVNADTGTTAGGSPK